MTQLLRVGELADKFAISPDTIRYYERNELLKPHSRSQAGYRLYDQKNQGTLNFILHAKNIGFTLQEIKYLLQIEENKEIYCCQTVKSFVDKKRQEVEERLIQLHRIEKILRQLSDSCEGDTTSAKYCSILDGIEIGRID